MSDGILFINVDGVEINDTLCLPGTDEIETAVKNYAIFLYKLKLNGIVNQFNVQGAYLGHKSIVYEMSTKDAAQLYEQWYE